MRTCDVLSAFQEPGESLRLSDIAARAYLSTSTAFRIIGTLERRGFLSRTGDRRYRLTFRLPQRRRFRIGYAGLGHAFAFSRVVTESVEAAASAANVELLVLDNEYRAQTAIRNAETFVREQVDLVIEFQADDDVAAIVSSKLMEAKIPLVAVDIPHAGATYFGANNYLAGTLGGRHLGAWAKAHWPAGIDEILLLELPRVGALPRSRLVGMLDGIRAVLPGVSDARVVWLNGRGEYGPSWEIVRQHLRRSRARRVLIGGMNDPTTLGALRAFEESERGDSCAAVSHNATLDARTELRKRVTPLVGAVAFFPERCGEALMALAVDLLEGKAVSPAAIIKHELVTSRNVNRLYPNDALLMPTPPR
jgi:ribose transport system substrate-binding protein